MGGIIEWEVPGPLKYVEYVFLLVSSFFWDHEFAYLSGLGLRIRLRFQGLGSIVQGRVGL